MDRQWYGHDEDGARDEFSHQVRVASRRQFVSVCSVAHAHAHTRMHAQFIGSEDKIRAKEAAMNEQVCDCVAIVVNACVLTAACIASARPKLTSGVWYGTAIKRCGKTTGYDARVPGRPLVSRKISPIYTKSAFTSRCAPLGDGACTHAHSIDLPLSRFTTRKRRFSTVVLCSRRSRRWSSR